MSDLHTDGNHVAGVLAEFLLPEATTVQRTCQSCGSEHPLAAHPVYHGAGVVLRCPSCSDVAIRVIERENELMLEWRGVYRMARVAAA